MRGGIPGVEEETYFSSHLDSLGQGTGVHCIVMPREPDWDVF